MNCFGYSAPGKTCMLYVYPRMSFINHNCRPNAEVCMEGDRGVLVALDKIPAGSEITISYIETDNINAEQRMNELNYQYYFICECEKCKREVL